MIRLHPVVRAAAVSIAMAAATFVATTPASATPNQNSTRTTTNAAGVTFHPHGDDFEVWNNLPYDSTHHNGYYVKVFYRVGNPRSGKFGSTQSFVTTLAHNTFREDMPEYPHVVQFWVSRSFSASTAITAAWRARRKRRQ
jgi:hypothetical protein